MKPSTYLSQDQLVSRAVNVLVRELGPVESARFLALPPPKRIESVRRHRQWQNTLNQEEFFKQVFGEQ